MSQALGNSRPVNGSRGKHSAFGGFRRWLRKLFRRTNGDSQLRETIEEIIDEIEEAIPEEEAATPIGSHERVLLGNILALRHLSADDVMVPRADIVSVAIDTGLDELTRIMNAAAHSRLPVYRDNLDDVLGMVHIKDVLKQAFSDRPFELANILGTVLFVAPSMRALDLLMEMRLKRVHMALVVDEYGGTAGIITLEMLLEEMVGPVVDELGRPEQEFQMIDEQTVRVDGGMGVHEAREDLDLPIPEGDYETVAGYALSLLGHLPAVGEQVEGDGLRITIVEVDERKIETLIIMRLPASPAAAAEAS